jgi:hypothetical protein
LKPNFDSSNQSNILTLELSDQYESFPKKFTDNVPKSHSNLVEMMKFFQEVCINGDRSCIRKNGKVKWYESIFVGHKS